VVSVVEELALAGLRVEIKEHMSEIISRMSSVLMVTEDPTSKQSATRKILQVSGSVIALREKSKTIF